MPAPTEEGFKCVFQASRWAALWRGAWLLFLSPPRLMIGSHSVLTATHGNAFKPWEVEEEHLALTKIASVKHIKGLLWDSISIESDGGQNTLDMRDLPKQDALEIIDVLHQHI
ncbi:MAG: hypothetical protein VKK59_06425 [Vampirovibrionales bacterium]|nr:hypothetical protein [Vampirovibrionales bacterium]